MTRSRPVEIDILRALERMGDQHRMVLPSGAIIVVDKMNCRAIVVAGMPESSIREAFASMGWKLVDRAEIG